MARAGEAQARTAHAARGDGQASASKAQPHPRSIAARVPLGARQRQREARAGRQAEQRGQSDVDQEASRDEVVRVRAASSLPHEPTTIADDEACKRQACLDLKLVAALALAFPSAHAGCTSRGSGSPSRRKPSSRNASPFPLATGVKTNVVGPVRSHRKPLRSYCTDRKRTTPNRRVQISRAPTGSNVTHNAWSPPSGGSPAIQAARRLRRERPRSTWAIPTHWLAASSSCRARTSVGNTAKRGPSTRR